MISIAVSIYQPVLKSNDQGFWIQFKKVIEALDPLGCEIITL